MHNDKKRTADKIKLVLPVTRLGVVDFDYQLPLQDLSKLV